MLESVPFVEYMDETEEMRPHMEEKVENKDYWKDYKT